MLDPRFANLRIVLVEPAGALNVGSIARIMKNMGLSHLVLVNPQCDPIGAEARQMAVHAPEILETATIVATLPEALIGCQRAIATTGLQRPLTTPLEPPRTALPWLLGDQIQPDSAALIFGREDRGLTNEELNYAHRLIYIPSSPIYPSLNLAQAVAICCYELFLIGDEGDRADGDDKGDGEAKRSLSLPSLPTSSSSPPLPSLPPLSSTHIPATLDTLEGFYQHLEAVLLQIGYLYPHTAASRMEKFRRLFHRSLPTPEEVAMLRGILSQVQWTVKQNYDRQ
ncbi:RNA methyltransferase [Pantanalinema sp. GBBB05]|uniref:RNA methyltransferase n=1 Tax=Pantanalinema sp. GBBB05 TaxID=2604139 RepID=UPI001D654C83|nr:RNA methyltransferase [Pantanalinema sp. GBBB05]